MSASRHIFTIGHSTHSTGKFLELLLRHGITAIADVRSQPYSRVNPHFNRENIGSALKGVGLGYVFVGKELGARTTDQDCYLNGKVQYDRLAATRLFQEGLQRIADGSLRHRIALMCAEKDPLTCHRTILVCRHLVALGLDVQHILDDGSLESHNDAMTRLMDELGMTGADLFQSRADLEREAYSRRGDQIAYIDKQVNAAPTHGSAR